MRLLRISNTGDPSLTEDIVGNTPIPPYAILSHTWGADEEEVTFEDITSGAGKHKPGYEKILFCEEQARQDNLQYFWIDTCCIKKTNKAEFSHALNSMFRWYCNSTRCYVYLSDVSSLPSITNNDFDPPQWELDFRKSKWFTRGWTLQELLAPSLVEFFSRDHMKLGDKDSLRRQIHEITAIPNPALQGAPLYQFSINERLSWIEHRQTKLEEDKAYSLQGIFDIFIPPIYGEGIARAFERLMGEISKLEKCMQDLHLTNPRDDKKRIEATKGGLLKDSYRWILENSDFQQWRDDQQSRLLWIKGSPGKGKTMLLCGIINEIEENTLSKADLLSYFFCQATDSRINNATAILRGLLYLLVDQQPSLVSHILRRYDHAGKALFEDVNAWVALSDIFTNILQDPSLKSTYLIVDALDECIVGLEKLLDFIVQNSCISTRIKWIISSRNWPYIEERLEEAGHKVRLCLELNAESVSTAVSTFIKYKVLQLADRKKYDGKMRETILSTLSARANDTFLWVALVCQDLEKIPRWKAIAVVNTFPPGLNPLYERMIQQICNSDDADDGDLYKRILALVATVYRPITLTELTSLVEELSDMADDLESLQQIIHVCGSFLTVRENTIYFVHQSAKDFLITKAANIIFPSGQEEFHYLIFERSLQVMSKTLRRDMYSLGAPGYPAELVQPPNPDPLAASRYSYIYWIDHVHDCNINSSTNIVDLQDEGAIHRFLSGKYLYWLEALSLCKHMSKGVASMAKLEALIQGRANTFMLTDLIRDARRFIMYHKNTIGSSPLQAYASALVFSPTRSLIRELFCKEEPDWINIRPAPKDSWSACLLTLEGHSDFVQSVAFTPDSTLLASASYDRTVKLWDAGTGECLRTLEGHSDNVNSVAFSYDSALLASASADKTVKIWDMSNGGEGLRTLFGHQNVVDSVAFSPNSSRLASASWDRTIKLWNVSSGDCLQTLEGHRDQVVSVAFSHDSAWIASAAINKSIKVWDATGKCLQTFSGDDYRSVAFSHDSKLLASTGLSGPAIFDISNGECLQLSPHPKSGSNSISFSHDSMRVASGSSRGSVEIRDVSSGDCLQTLEGHSDSIRSISFSHNSARLVSASTDNTIKIWDMNNSNRVQGTERYARDIRFIALSHDSSWLASISFNGVIKLWDTTSGACRHTLRGHDKFVFLVVFSHDSAQLASASGDRTVKIWDVTNGECLQTLYGYDSMKSVAFSYDSTQLASVENDTVRIWNKRSGKCLQIFKLNSSTIAGMGFSSSAFSHDSTRLASVSGDRTVKIWEISSGKCIHTLDGHGNYFTLVTFSHDSTLLASASIVGPVMIWDANSGRFLLELDGIKTANKLSRLYSISFNSTGSYLHTDVGSIVINTSPSVLRKASIDIEDQEAKYQRAEYHGWALDTNKGWVTCNSENMLSIPSEYRPGCSAATEKTIAVANNYGEIWIYKFKNL